MSIIQRNDGVVFVLQPHRQRLDGNNRLQVRKEIRELAESRGDRVRLFQTERGAYDVVFSSDAGYLFGETVWHHFDKPFDLIYCEVSDHAEGQALLVVVRNSKIILDSQLPCRELKEQIKSVMMDNAARFVVYIHGDVPVDFSQSVVKTLAKLPRSLLYDLKTESRFQLLPVQKVLDSFDHTKKQRATFIVIFIIGLLLLADFVWYARLQETPVVVNPYEQYAIALQTPDPGQQMASLLYGLNCLGATPGWFTESFDYNGEIAKVTLYAMGGSALSLMANAQRHRITINFSGDTVTANFMPMLKDRLAPSRMTGTEQVIAVIIDRMMQILPTSSVRVLSTENRTVYKETNIIIMFNKIAPDILQLMGSNLDDLPVSVTKCQATINNGLISGTLQLKVVGK